MLADLITRLQKESHFLITVRKELNAARARNAVNVQHANKIKLHRCLQLDSLRLESKTVCRIFDFKCKTKRKKAQQKYNQELVCQHQVQHENEQVRHIILALNQSLTEHEHIYDQKKILELQRHLLIDRLKTDTMDLYHMHIKSTQLWTMLDDSMNSLYKCQYAQIKKPTLYSCHGLIVFPISNIGLYACRTHLGIRYIGSIGERELIGFSVEDLCVYLSNCNMAHILTQINTSQRLNLIYRIESNQHVPVVFVRWDQIMSKWIHEDVYVSNNLPYWSTIE